MTKVNLPRSIVNSLLRQAQSSTEQEICGLISIDDKQQLQVIPVSNVADEPARFFQMDPAETISAMKTIRENKQQLFAIYHSHPSSPAIPSKADIEQAGYPDALYLIISLNTVGVLELKGFKINNGTVVDIDLAL